jgi:hypothetical protein
MDFSHCDKDVSQPSLCNRRQETKHHSVRCSPPIQKISSSIIKEFFDRLQDFHISRTDTLSEKYSSLMGIFDRVKSKEREDYDRSWKSFIKLTIAHFDNFERKELTIVKKYNEQLEKFLECRDMYEEEKKKNAFLETKFNEEILELNKVISGKDQALNKLEKVSKELKQKLDNKVKCESNEIYLYTQKQLLRDNALLTNDNKQFREHILQLEKEIDSLRAKDVKMMRLLFTLSRKGIAINDILENELKSNQNTIQDNMETYKEEPSSINDSIYGPIYVEPRKTAHKPEIVPALNLTNINNSYCNFISDESSKKEIKVNSNFSEQNFSE